MNIEKQSRFSNIANKINIEGLASDPMFLENKLKSNKINKNFIEILNETKEILQSIYPDNWDIQLDIDRRKISEVKKNFFGYEYVVNYSIIKYMYFIVIKFPIIVINTEENLKHTIRDIFVKFYFNYCEESDNIYISNIYGSRTTYTPLEYLNKYNHSHLGQDNTVDNINSFYTLDYVTYCLGKGEINDLLKELNMNFNFITFKLFLHSIKSYLEWESKEGKPYRYVENIIKKEKPKTLYDTNKVKYFEKLLNSTNNKIINLKWIFNNNKIKLIDNDDFENYCLLGIENINSSNIDLVTLKDENKEYIKYTTENQISDNILIDYHYYLIFKKEKLKNNIVNVNSIILTNKYYIHPELKKYIKNELEQRSNKAIVRKSIIERINKVGYTEESIE